MFADILLVQFFIRCRPFHSKSGSTFVSQRKYLICEAQSLPWAQYFLVYTCCKVKKVDIAICYFFFALLFLLFRFILKYYCTSSAAHWYNVTALITYIYDISVVIYQCTSEGLSGGDGVAIKPKVW